ncbi:MAG: orotate phosphoribosyltransferase [Flavobacteriales bacterium]|nr:orotate phosphoribosyltransferase [Flavobacteriales bacterium]
MILNDDVAKKTAELLLQIKAIKLNPGKPFQWASGWLSPIYCDNRKTLSYPKVRTYIRQQLADGLEEKFGRPDVIAGVATGAIAHGVLAAQALDIPFVYVRPKPKEHGLGNQIEGDMESGQSVVIIEDLISTGMSSLSALEAIRQAGGNVKGMISIFDYGFKQSETAFAESNCTLFSLSGYATLLEVAAESQYINRDELKTLEAWHKQPSTWKP